MYLKKGDFKEGVGHRGKIKYWRQGQGDTGET